MTTRLHAWLFVCLALFAAGIASAAESGPRPTRLLFGSVAMDIPAIMHRRLSPLTRHLGARLGMPVTLRLSPDMDAAIQALASGQVDLAYLTPVAYVRAHEQGGAQLLVKTRTEGRDHLRLMIVVRQDSPWQRVGELAGQRFAFGDRAALLQRIMLEGAGLKLEHLADYRFLGHNDNIARAVLNGDFDAGILKDTLALQWQGRGLRILYTSPELPPYNISVRAGLEPALVARLRQAFLALDPARPVDRDVIKALDPRYDGFVAATDEEYDVVRQLIAPVLEQTE